MGEVWKARDTRLDRIVAIKISSAKLSERFDREARAIAALNHPNICQLYDVGPDYIVMEYVEGSEIKGPLPLDAALKTAIQLAAALEAAHRKSITHRDLKPANILTTKSGVKVLDFGLAKFEVMKPRPDEATQTRALTEEGSIVGTLQYMAPEQLQGKPTDARSDIFSFGCVLYEILTGKRAFRGEDQATLIAAIMDRDPEPLTPMTPPMLAHIVKKCLAKDPDDRWQSASDLKGELQWVLESGSSAGMPAPVVETRRRNARLGWILAGVFAALLAAFAIFHFRSTPAPAAITRFEIPPPEGTSWGAGDFPHISPDGSRILFGAMKQGSHSLWIRPMDSVHAQPIPGTDDNQFVYAGYAAWSPDGRSIVHSASAGLKRLDASGGSPQLLGSVLPAVMPAWSPAGIILFSGRDAPYALYQVPASGGEAKRALASGGYQYFPSFLPDGRRFLYFVYNEADPGIYIGSLDAKEGRRIGAGSSAVFVPPSWLLYVRNSTLVAHSFDPEKASLSGDPIPIADQVATVGPGGAFSVSQNGVLAYRRALPPASTELTWYDRNGKKLGTVGEEAVYTSPALSPDGKRLAVARLDSSVGTRDIWVIDLARNTSSRFTFDKADDVNPLWSPDGSRIAYSSARKSANLRDLFWKPAGGAGAEEVVLENGDNKALEDWSPDGKLLLYNVASQHIAAVPVSGDRKQFPVLKTEFKQDHARVSPDGRWIAYVSRESGKDEVFVQNFPPSGGKWQVSNNGGTEPSWRRDGKELYFVSGSKFKAVDIKASGSTFEAGIPKDLFEVQLDPTNRRNRYVPAPDGQRFLCVTVSKSIDTVPFVVVQNWQSALKH
jgi:Tol biopolymer transport system component